MDQSRPATTAITGKFGVRIPRALRDHEHATPGAIWLAAVLTSKLPSGQTQVKISHARLAEQLGCAEKTIQRAVAELLATGVWTSKRGPIHAPTVWTRVITPGGQERYDVIPHATMKAIMSGDVKPAQVPIWLHLDQALGSAGSTPKGPADLAQVAGVSPKTISRTVSHFADLGLIVLRRPTVGQWVLYRPEAAEHAQNLPSPAPVDDGQKCPPTPDRFVHPIKNLAKDLLANEQKPLSFELCEHRYVTNARESDEALRAKTGDDRDGGQAEQAPVIEDHSPPSKPAQAETVPGQVPATRRLDVAEVLANTPRDLIPAWQRRYKPGVAQTIADALDAGMPAPIAASALHRLVDDTTTGGKILPAIRYALTTAANEHRHGLLCSQCGDPRDVHGCSPNHCATTAQGQETEIDPAVLAAVHAHLGIVCPTSQPA